LSCVSPVPPSNGQGKIFDDPPEVLANRELMEIFLPVIRADLMLGDTYLYEFDGILDIPIKVLVGSMDPDVKTEQLYD
jgi:medium-chain acyl-[acyl-carrier-protein] hydrolase